MQPIIAARSPWVSGPASRIAPSPAGVAPGSFAHPGKARRESTGDVEEVELLDVMGEAADLGGERREERLPHHRLGCDQLAEAIARKDVGLRRLDGDRGRGARRSVEQGELAEEVARTERREDRLVARIGGQGDLDGTRHHDEQRVARVAEVEDRLVAPKPPDPHPLKQAPETALVEPAEQRNRGEGVAHGPDVDHAAIVPRPSGRNPGRNHDSRP